MEPPSVKSPVGKQEDCSAVPQQGAAIEKETSTPTTTHRERNAHPANQPYQASSIRSICGPDPNSLQTRGLHVAPNRRRPQARYACLYWTACVALTSAAAEMG